MLLELGIICAIGVGLFLWLSFVRPWFRDKLREKDSKVTGVNKDMIKLRRKPLKVYSVTELRGAWYIFSERYRFDLRKSTRLKRKLLKAALRAKLKEEKQGG
jgi:hypothetical protein